MDAADLAQIIMDYLIDRDDVAGVNDIGEPPTETAELGVETQGGTLFIVRVEPA